MTTATRETSFGQLDRPSLVDRFGVWLSRRSIDKHLGSLNGKRVADIGCGFDASLGRQLARDASHVTLLDVALADHLFDVPNITALVGPLEEQLGRIADASIDVLFCVSVLEHLDDDRTALHGFRRVLAP
ncbi:MAG: methyltransferase domain-containing protein, partial [Actinomycetota bacterium]|nr:methyltransferase domain-containing protein [Actinomycetota bacterium]